MVQALNFVLVVVVEVLVAVVVVWEMVLVDVMVVELQDEIVNRGRY